MQVYTKVTCFSDGCNDWVHPLACCDIDVKKDDICIQSVSWTGHEDHIKTAAYTWKFNRKHAHIILPRAGFKPPLSTHSLSSVPYNCTWQIILEYSNKKFLVHAMGIGFWVFYSRGVIDPRCSLSYIKTGFRLILKKHWVSYKEYWFLYIRCLFWEQTNTTNKICV
jgi:hypothetical protein